MKNGFKIMIKYFFWVKSDNNCIQRKNIHKYWVDKYIIKVYCIKIKILPITFPAIDTLMIQLFEFIIVNYKFRIQ